MEESEANTLQEDREDALSFRDLPMTDDEDDVVPPHADHEPRNSDFFEFASCAEPAAEALPFCAAPPPSECLFARHPRNGLFIRGDSFNRRSHSLRAASEGGGDDVVSSSSGPAVSRSSSVRFGRFFGDSGKTARLPAAAAMATPGRHKAVIGVVKIEAKMEMSDMRRRQSRRRAGPVTMFPAGCGGAGEVVPAVAGHGEGGGLVVGKSGNNYHHWGCLFKPLRSRANLVGTLTKFGCIPHV